MKHALVLGGIIAVFVILARKEVFSWPYYYDEADYMFAASLGWANYSDQGSQPLAEYIQAGLQDRGHPTRRAQLSARSRASSDVNFYRHWHGPLYFYWLAGLAPLHLDEHASRSLSYLFPALTAVLIFLGSLWLLPSGAGALAAAFGSAFYLWSYATVFTNEIAPHQLFVLFTLAALLLVMKWRQTGDRRIWHGAVILSACAFCTLEVAFVLLIVLIACRLRSPSQSSERWITKSMLTFLATVLFLWPAALLKLSFVKAYLFMAYLALMRQSPWGGIGFVEVWRLRFAQSPVEWLLLVLAAVLYFRLEASVRTMLAPLLLFGVLMLCVLLRVNSETPRYMLPFLPAFETAAGFVFASVLSSRAPALRFASSAVILVLAFSGTYTQLRTHPIRPAPRLAAVLDQVRAEKLKGQKLLAPQNDLPMIHYYVPGVILSGYVAERERSMLLGQDTFDAVLYPGYPVSLKRQFSASPHYLSQR